MQLYGLEFKPAMRRPEAMADYTMIALREAVKDSFYSEIDRLSSVTAYYSNMREACLSRNTIRTLSERILCLPEEGILILFAHYCFRLTFEEMEDLYEIENAAGKSLYFKELLRCGLGIEKEKISESAFAKACRLAMLAYVKAETSSDDPSSEIVSGYKPVIPDRKNRRILRPKHILFAAAMLAVMLFCSVNAEVREKITSWFVETFEDNTLFKVDGNPKEVDVSNYEITYVPQDALLADHFESQGFVSYRYEVGGTDYFVVYIAQPETNIFSNTEGAEIEPFNLDGADGFWYENDALGNVILEREGVPFLVCGTLDRDELIRIALGIREIKK
jgi:hypothetical protein